MSTHTEGQRKEMAAEISIEKTMQKLEQEITCPVCHDHFNEPKILPCLHYYCKECVQALADRAGPNQTFPCPECRADTRLPQNDPAQLPTAFFVNRMKDLHVNLETAHKQVEARCQLCSGDTAEGFCHHCVAFICGDCIKMHKKVRTFKGHEVLTLDELKTGGAKALMVKPPPQTCKKHDEQLKIYCFDCNTLICRDCLLKDHAGHKYGFVKETAPQCKEVLVGKKSLLSKVRRDYSNAADRVKSMMTEIEDQSAQNTGAINHWIQEWTQVIQDCGGNLLDEVASLTKEKIDVLIDQMKYFENASTAVQSLEDFCDQNIDNATDEEFMAIHTQIYARVEEESKKHEGLALKVDEIANIGVKLPSNQTLIDLCHNGVKVVLLDADPASSTITVDSEAVEVGKSLNITVRTLYPNRTPCSKPQTVKGELKSLVSVYDVEYTEAMQKDGCEYEMVFTPEVRGRHQLTVTVNDEKIPECPLNVFVGISPDRIGLQPARVISSLNTPYGVAFNSAEEVFVTMPGIIRVFDKNGANLRKITLPKTLKTVKDPTGIAIDEEDNIYVADRCSECILKLDKGGKVLKTVGTLGEGPSEFKDVRGVSIIQNQLFVCDGGNNRIQVFNKELHFVKTIGTQGNGNGQFKFVYDVSQDKEGNLYVCDGLNHRIQVLSSEGVFLYAFSSRGDYDHLMRPVGVCVSDAFVYVTEWGASRLSVFQKSGKFVRSFGDDPGSSKGNFRNPYTVRVNRDGFVYVCDYFNDRVQIF